MVINMLLYVKDIITLMSSLAYDINQVGAPYRTAIDPIVTLTIWCKNWLEYWDVLVLLINM